MALKTKVERSVTNAVEMKNNCWYNNYLLLLFMSRISIAPVAGIAGNHIQ